MMSWKNRMYHEWKKKRKKRKKKREITKNENGINENLKRKILSPTFCTHSHIQIYYHMHIYFYENYKIDISFTVD